MIIGRITAKAQTTIPKAVRTALGLSAGDEIAYEIEGDRVIMRRARVADDPFLNDFSAFSEWSSEADCKAFDNF